MDNRLLHVMLFLFASTEIQWSSWLEPFQYQLWLSIVGIINLILIVIWWIDRKSPYGHYRQLDSGDDGFTILGIRIRLTLYCSNQLKRRLLCRKEKRGNQGGI